MHVSRLRLIMLSLCATCAMSAAASASASAAKCHEPEKEGDVAVCVAKEEITGTNVPFTSEKAAETGSELNVTAGPRIVCELAKNTGEFVTADPSLTVKGLRIEFTKCAVTNAELTCEVKEPIVAEGNGAFTGEDTSKVTFTGAKAEETFALITIKSKAGKTCNLASENTKTKGTQTCNLPESEEELVTHTVECLTTGSTLKYGGKTAVFNLTETLKLSGAFEGKAWGLMGS